MLGALIFGARHGRSLRVMPLKGRRATQDGSLAVIQETVRRVRIASQIDLPLDRQNDMMYANQ
jgi:hypothetical protein